MRLLPTSSLVFLGFTVACGGSPPVPTPAPSTSTPELHAAHDPTGDADAQDPRAVPHDAGTTGILVMAHGGDPAWNAQVDAALSDLRSRTPVALAFGMADRHTLQASLDTLAQRGVRRVAVVRLFLSGRSFEDQTRYLLGLSPEPPEVFLHHGAHGPSMGAPPPPVRTGGVRLATHRDGLMDWSGLGSILAERARAAGALPGGAGIIVIGHGMGDEALNQEVLDRIDQASQGLRDLGLGPVVAETLREDWPEARATAEERIRGWVAEAGGKGTPVVLPFRLSGFGPYAEVLDGLAYRPGDALLPHESVAEWIEATARRIASDRGWSAPGSEKDGDV